MKKFLDKDFLLENETAKILYHNFAAKMPIFDYHCHLPVKDIYENTQFSNLTQIWLYGDHYKWRAMRANGISEEKITGEASDWEKFLAWSETVPNTIGNPLFHWTHLELRRYFDINTLLSTDTAKDIYDKSKKLLQSDNFRVRSLLEKMNVKILCTTDDPIDSLKYHKLLAQDSNFSVRVLPTFRPDKALMVENPEIFNKWVNILENVTKIPITDYESFISALQIRHDYFEKLDCKISDHGLEYPVAENFAPNEIEEIFLKVREGNLISKKEILQIKTSLMIEFAKMNKKKNWTMQIHLGAIRNSNSLMFKKLGPDTGFDSIGDYNIANTLGKFLNILNNSNSLPKMIIYSVNPKDYEVISTMIGNFQDGITPGKLQHGSAWWFNDQKVGIERHLISIANHGLLSRFVGMLTDSRSFLSFPRHEYFRRILCNMIGKWVENGELPDNLEKLGKIVQKISYENAENYFGIRIDKDYFPHNSQFIN
ncbi:MAG: glucuronate isomerase [Promethearchaeota archaeon]